MKTVMIGDRRFKLIFIDLIPFDEKQFADLKESIEEAGKITVPIVCWKEKRTSGEETVVDGAHRVLIAADMGLNVPIREQSFESEEEAKKTCLELNRARRHMTIEQQQSGRAERVKRIEALAKEGATEREIAAAEGVSQTQVRRDLNRTAQKLCPACQTKQRKGQQMPHACPDCKKLKREKKKKKQMQPTELKDNFGNVIPAKLKHAWGDSWIQDTYDLFAEMLDDLLTARVPAGVNKRAKYFPFFRHKDINDGCGFIQQYLDQIIEHIRDNRPAGVCPSCEGKGCHHCRESGLVPKSVYEKLKK